MGNVPLSAPWSGTITVRLRRDEKADIVIPVNADSEWTIEHTIRVVSAALHMNPEALVCSELTPASLSAKKLRTLRACGLKPGVELEFDEALWSGTVTVYVTERDTSFPVTLRVSGRTTIAQLLFDVHIATGLPVSLMHLGVYDASTGRWREFNSMHATLASCGVHAATSLRVIVSEKLPNVNEMDNENASFASAAAKATHDGPHAVETADVAASDINATGALDRMRKEVPPLRISVSPAGSSYAGLGADTATLVHVHDPHVRALTPSLARMEGRSPRDAIK